GFESVDNANGNDFVITKPTLVAVLNSSGGAALTVTISLPASRHTAEAATTKTAAVADTKIGLFLLLPDLHKQSDGKAWIDFSAATATVAVAELTHTPGFSY
ncbi:MAG: hypothetical protein ABIH03_00975, partial [Pseudomonadota bacterium]